MTRRFVACFTTKYLFYGFLLTLLCGRAVSWTVWPNNFHHDPRYHHYDHHVKSLPAWIDPTFNHHQPFYPQHHATIPDQYHLPLPYHDFNTRNNYPATNNDYLSSISTSQVGANENNPPLNQSSTVFKVSNPIVRHVSTKNNNDRKGNLMLYQAPPSYDRIMDPPPSILITSRPFSVTTSTEKNSDFLAGEVKLASSPHVQFSPQQNIAVDERNGPNWNTAVTLQVSLRPGSWTKSKRPTISDKMKQFLPELKYYKKGLKAVDMNRIKNKVEKYVLVSKKEPEEVVTQPTITIMANDLLVYPQDSTQESEKEIKLVDDWDSDSEEEQESVHQEAPVMQKIEVFTPGPPPILNSNLTKMPSKSIEDIVAEVFATVTGSTVNEDESDEKGSSSQRVKGLSDLFDMIYGKNSSVDKEVKEKDDSWLQAEPKNTTVELITAPPDVIPLPKLENTIRVGFKGGNDDENDEQTTTKSPEDSSSTVTHSVTTENGLNSDEVTIRCQGMWCHHSTPQSNPVALKSQQNWEKAGNEVNPHDDVPHIDPLLSYLGLAWPQHDRQSKAFQSTQPTNPTVLQNITSTTTALSTHKMGVTEELTSSSSPLPLPYFNDNDGNNFLSTSDNRASHNEELKDFKQSGNDINASASPVTQVSREHLEAMFNALGHGFGQVMSIVMPLALPIQRENDPSESSALNVDFNSFFRV